jgi:hypothetical protein
LQDKRRYEATLRKTKTQSWKQYCNATTSSNPWNVVYKLATGKFQSCSTLSTLRKPNGTVTTDMAETISFIMDSFTPADEEETDKNTIKQLGLRSKHR